MRNSFPECVCFCVGENACVFLCEHVCVGVCVCVYVTLLWQSANQANCSKMTFGTRQLQKPSSCGGRSGTEVDGRGGGGSQAMILSNCCADAEAGLEQLSELELQLKLDWDAANGQSKTHSTGNFGFALRRHRQLCWQIDSRVPLPFPLRLPWHLPSQQASPPGGALIKLHCQPEVRGATNVKNIQNA